jgi:hypothetical protein
VGAGDPAPAAHLVAATAIVLPEEDELAPDDQTAGIDSPEVKAGDTWMVPDADEASPRSWRRADDDILYRPSRRPRSPRRAWRDRVSSRG